MRSVETHTQLGPGLTRVTEQTAQRRNSHPTWPRPDEGGKPPDLGRLGDNQIQKHKESGGPQYL
ncbi:hypothetical protein J6590_077347 [Homalodisca vitripennis]|nr:hypothetical protein J6590_077347 [Homalodisca vitripennis]